MITMELCKLGYKISHDKIPKPISTIVSKRGGMKQHKYSTRNKSTPNMQQHLSTQFNKLPQELKMLPVKELIHCIHS